MSGPVRAVPSCRRCGSMCPDCSALAAKQAVERKMHLAAVSRLRSLTGPAQNLKWAPEVLAALAAARAVGATQDEMAEAAYVTRQRIQQLVKRTKEKNDA